jgi:hypothetical protein
MPIDALRRLFRSVTGKKAEKKAESKPRPRDFLYDTNTKERVYISPEDAEVAADLLAKPLVVRGKSAADVAEMAKPTNAMVIDEQGRPRNNRGGPTDTEMRRYADEIDEFERTRRNSGLRSVRTGYGGPIRAGDGYLAFGSNDPQPMQGGMKKGGKVKGPSSTGSTSKRGDGIAQRGKTKGRFV